MDIGSLLYALVNVVHPDWLIRSNFRLRRSDNLHKDSLQTGGHIHELKMIMVVFCYIITIQVTEYREREGEQGLLGNTCESV